MSRERKYWTVPCLVKFCNRSKIRLVPNVAYVSPYPLTVNRRNKCYLRGLQLQWRWLPPAEQKSKDIKRKTTFDICQFLLHFTTYFPNVSYVNSKRPRMEDCSNEWEKKQGRRQEEKEEETKDGEDGRRERTANGRERKRDESNFIWIPGLKWLRGKHNPLSLSVSTIITSLLLHLE